MSETKVTVVAVPKSMAPLARMLLETTKAVSAEGWPFRVIASPSVDEDTAYLVPGVVGEDDVLRSALPVVPTPLIDTPDQALVDRVTQMYRGGYFNGHWWS